MILPYTLRLLCLCFASFFLIHAALGLAVWTATPGAIRIGESMRPRSGARFLLALRLLPVTLAAFVVSGLCVPSYLWLETNEATERAGLICCAMALLGLFVCASSLARSTRALLLSARQARRYKREGRSDREGNPLPVTIMNSDTPVLALAGLIRPRVIVSRGVLQTLSREELKAALEHEHAHRKSQDNLKRLVLFLAPEIFPFSRGFTRLNRCWARLVEWAADDEATAGDSRRSLSLAAALVHMARMGAAPTVSPLASSFIGNDQDLAIRVDRLLGLAPIRENLPRRARALLGMAVALIAVLAIAVMIRPSTFFSVHHLLEQLLR
jgi:beta-lactamase regulating signal transducer with metallopeptidase domain